MEDERDGFNPLEQPGSADQVWTADKIERVLLTALVFANVHLRKHPKRQLRKLARLIERYGFVVPILIDQDNTIIAGEARVLAAEMLGLKWLPAIRLKHLTDPEVRSLRIADNRLAELSSWDKQTLSVELIQLSDLGFELDLTAFEVAEVDVIVKEQLAKPRDTALDDCPTANFREPAISALGDVWICGEHRIGCGDARDEVFVRMLLGASLVSQVLVDVPFNVKISGHVGGKGRIKHPEFVVASGELTDPEFREFLLQALTVAADTCKDGALLYVFIDWRSIDKVVEVGKAMGLHYINLCVWTKTNSGMGSFYRSQHELVVVFKKGDAAHTNNIELGRFGRNRSNVWPYEGANSINPARRKELALHPTVKPTQLCIDAILDCTNRGEVVLDTFLGSGTTLVAAEDSGRVCRGADLSPHYVDVAIRRWQEFTSGQARHALTGMTFDEVVRSKTKRAPLLLSAPRGDI